MSKKTIRESLLSIDKHFLGTDKYKDLTTLYESQDISGKDKATLKKLIDDIKNKEDLQDAIFSILQENVSDEYQFDEAYNDPINYSDFRDWCEKQYWPDFNPMDLSDDEYYALEDAYRASLKEDINESDTLNDDEFDYFAVYEGDVLQGEYPTYFDAKENCKGNSCIIKGVKQYGPHEYEETPLNEDIESDYSNSSDNEVYIAFNFLIDDDIDISHIEKTLKFELDKEFNTFEIYVDCPDYEKNSEMVISWAYINYPSFIPEDELLNKAINILEKNRCEFLKTINYDDYTTLRELVLASDPNFYD